MRMMCKECGEHFELMPGKRGFANVCPTCTESADDTARKAAEQESLRKALKESIREIRRDAKRNSTKIVN